MQALVGACDQGRTMIALPADLRRFYYHRQVLGFYGLPRPHEAVQASNARLCRNFCIVGQVSVRQRDNSFLGKLGRYVAGHAADADRWKAMKARAAKMARLAHAVIKTVTEYRTYLGRQKCWV